MLITFITYKLFRYVGKNITGLVSWFNRVRLDDVAGWQTKRKTTEPELDLTEDFYH